MKLKEEREVKREERRKFIEEKKSRGGDYDDYGYHRQTGEYDEFYDKYKTSNYIPEGEAAGEDVEYGFDKDEADIEY